MSVSMFPLTRLHTGFLRLVQSPFNSPMWLDEKPNSTWYMAVGYRDFNKLTPHICMRIPNTVRVLDTISSLKTQYCVLDFSNAFLSLPLDGESWDQCAFPWEGRQWTFTVLTPGYQHSPTIWDGGPGLSPSFVLCYYTGDIMITCDDLLSFPSHCIFSGTVKILKMRGKR